MRNGRDHIHAISPLYLEQYCLEDLDIPVMEIYIQMDILSQLLPEVPVKLFFKGIQVIHQQGYLQRLFGIVVGYKITQPVLRLDDTPADEVPETLYHRFPGDMQFFDHGVDRRQHIVLYDYLVIDGIDDSLHKAVVFRIGGLTRQLLNFPEY